jgi:hypothetical protein
MKAAAVTARMKTAAVGTAAAAVGSAADAGPAAGRICIRDAAMIEAAESAGMIAAGCTAGTDRFTARKSAGVTESTGVTEP